MDLVDELSSTACAACKHPKAFHRPNNGACYGHPDKDRLSLSLIDLAEIELRKQFGAECWCPKYCADPVEGKAQLLLHGSSTLLLKSAWEAIKEGDYDFARRCYNAYALKSGLNEHSTTIAEILNAKMRVIQTNMFSRTIRLEPGTTKNNDGQ